MRGALLLALGLPGSALAVTAGDHRGERVGDHITWESRYDLERGEDTVLLAGPVRVELVGVQGGSPVWDGSGALVALDVTDARGVLTLVTRQKLDGTGLSAPLARGAALQRVTLIGVTLEPDPSLGLERHVGHWASPGVRASDRKALDRRLDGRFRVRRGSTFYVVADALEGGLTGTVATREEVRGASAWTAAALFLGALLAGLGLHRWLERGARRDRVDRYLREEIGDRTAPSD